MEVPEDSNEVLDWGSSDEITEFTRSPGAIRVDNYYSEEDSRGGTGGVFDDHYDPRQVTFLLTNAIHANLYQQYDSHVAYNAKHVISVDMSKINRNSLAHCAKCQKDKMAQFIADTGASNTFTFDKNDFVTFVEDDGTIQTANKKAVLQVQGYGTIFIKHDINIKGKVCTVTSKLQPVYYAPEISYQLFSIGSLLQKGYCLKGDKAQISITKPSGDTVLEFHPHTSDPNIYWLNAKIIKDQKSLSNLALLAHGYDLWHE